MTDGNSPEGMQPPPTPETGKLTVELDEQKLKDVIEDYKFAFEQWRDPESDDISKNRNAPKVEIARKIFSAIGQDELLRDAERQSFESYKRGNASLPPELEGEDPHYPLVRSERTGSKPVPQKYQY